MLIISLFTSGLYAQVDVHSFSHGHMHMKEKVAFMPKGEHHDHHFVPPPATWEYFQEMGKKSGVSITVDYDQGFIDNPSAQSAFQFAVDIWAGLINSDIPIRVEASFLDLTQPPFNAPANALGGAGPSDYYRNFSGANRFDTWYPVALAEKLAQRELNPSDSSDIEAFFNTTAEWYFGTDGNPPANASDMVSVVLHELCHGIGFTGFADVDEDSGQGFIELQSSPVIFDRFLVDQQGRLATNTSVYPDPSPLLGDLFTSGALFFSGPSSNAVNAASPVNLYAPSSFAAGSSIHHLDDQFNNTPNRLMTRAIALGTSIQNPGSLALAMLEDIGWVNTFIKPDTLANTEMVPDSIEVRALVSSDSVLTSNSITLHYSLDTFNTELTTIMMPTANENEFSGYIKGFSDGTQVGYYVSAQDNTNRTYFAPANAPNDQIFFFFFVGQDTIGPTIQHTPEIDFLTLTTTTIPISANVEDLFGVDSVFVEYLYNGTVQDTVGLTFDNTTLDLYTGKIDLDSISQREGDSVSYRIIARDQSTRQNLSFNPSEGFINLLVEVSSAAQTEYENNFNDPSAGDDFLGSTFSIETPNGFANGAIHSTHPYPLGGDGNELSFTYQLRVPIIINNTNPFMQFDEIVLVEPGNEGAVFGQLEFWDFVIVEGSKDDGVTWRGLLDGYDCQAQAVWFNQFFTIGDADGNSRA
ncbi:MAG: hypothetical protein AAFU64_06180, partial [Bacteroidota bacterium]